MAKKSRRSLTQVQQRIAELTTQREAAVRRGLAVDIEMGLLVDRYIQGCPYRPEIDSLLAFSLQTDVPVEELRACLEMFRTTPHPYGYAWRQD